MAGNQVAADHIRQAQGLFQIDRTRLGQTDGTGGGFPATCFHGEGVAFLGNHGQADAVVGDGVAKRNLGNIQLAGVNMQTAADFARGDFGNAADCRDDS